jgi:choline dehydrogenase-like flavoprotein
MAVAPLSSLPDGSVIEADVAIVGGGAAGITLAAELQGSGLEVVMFEGGGLVSTPVSQARYQGELTVSDGVVYPPLDGFRLRYLGGTTNHWVGWCRPLEPNVFDPRPGRTDRAWPFARAELDRAYVRAHQLCELGRFEYDAPTLLEDGGYQVPIVESDILTMAVFRFSPPVRFGATYLELLETGDVDTYLEANCVGLTVDRGRVIDARFRGEEGNACTVRAGHVVLACGGIENVRQLLLLEREGAPELGRSGTLGLGFMEHPHIPRASWFLADPDWGPPGEGPLFARAPDVDGTPFRLALGLRPEVLETEGMMNVSFTLHDGTDLADAELPHSTAAAALHGAWRGGRPRLVGLFSRTEMRPGVDSRIRLTGEIDDLGMPRAGLDLRVSDLDQRDIVRARTLVARELMKQGLGPARPLADGRTPEELGGGGHHLGGAPMHHDPDHGVVDADLRCHALENLYVVGGATFPTTCFSNPTLTIVALAVRLAEHLRSVT